MRSVIIRRATAADAAALAVLEAACFPPAEAAPAESIRARLDAFPEWFWVGEDGGRLVSCVNGMRSSERDLADAMYADASLHEPDGPRLMVFGVLTAPERQGEGLASEVMQQAVADCRVAGLQELVLTCKPRLIGFYERFGFLDEGVSVSEHGGAVWHQMRLEL